MYSSIRVLTTALVIATLFLVGCAKDKCDRSITYIKTIPVYKTYEEVHQATIENQTTRALKNPGKIYYYQDYIFINEIDEGIHVIDNSTPESPTPITFIAIPGNEDISIKNDLLYANSYVDLLAIGMNDINAVTLQSRNENVFRPLWHDQVNERYLVDYIYEEVTEVVDCKTSGLFQEKDGYYYYCPNCPFNGWLDDLNVVDTSPATSTGSEATGSQGVAGSMARFSIINEVLYVVEQSTLKAFELSGSGETNLVNTTNLGWGIETIFPLGDHLFIGSNSGMHIYNISQPSTPSFVSEFAHARACDPVFVKDNYAYVTLRDGNECAGYVNQLDLIDITDLHNPELIESFPMDNPHGLSIRENTLILCEGEKGIKSFDISQPTVLDEHLLDTESSFFAYDAITLPTGRPIVFVIGKDGFYQYDITDPNQLNLISKIEVNK